ncbi:MAG: beta-propeller domain-containing protein [Solirubrobacteraceae bacterium]
MPGRVLVLLLALAALGAPAADAAGLRPFPSCPALLDYARTHGQQAVKTGWVPAPMPFEGPVSTGVPPMSTKGGEIAPATPQASQDSAGSTAGGETFSTTNVQEAGVDEPDVVKTDGTTIYAVANGWLHAIDASAETPVLLDAVELDPGYGHELLLHGDRLVVVQTAWLQDDENGYGRPVTRMTEVDVSDPSKLTVLRRERDDGEYVSARMTGDTARIVLASRAPVVYDIAATSAPSRRAAVGRRLRQVRRAKLSAWRPHTFFRDVHRPKHARFHALTSCGQLRHTARFSGLDTITILTVDMAKGLPSVDADAVMSDAQYVYASTDRLYVATTRWQSDARTEIHEFDTSQPDRTTYVASGSVEGSLLNQFSMSEHKGVLRVAATRNTDSAVTTLDRDTMDQLGKVEGLGEGERIYAVRFLGDTGYVVTFRQVDPLYTLDLSDPEAPRVAGELKIAGYSAYLHPIGDDLLLGIGQDAGADGRTTGTQLSLFDVSDPANPRRLAQYAIAGGSSTAEYDHHAFLYWPKTKLAVVPLTTYSYDEKTDTSTQFVGAVGFRVERTGIDEAGRIEHPADDYSLWDIQRATVIGDRLFTLSAAGMMASPLDTLGSGPFVAFPDKPANMGYGGCGDVIMPAGPDSPVASCAAPSFAAR